MDVVVSNSFSFLSKTDIASIFKAQTPRIKAFLTASSCSPLSILKRVISSLAFNNSNSNRLYFNSYSLPNSINTSLAFFSQANSKRLFHSFSTNCFQFVNAF